MAHHGHRRATELPVLVWGRPVKPLALALMLACGVLGYINLAGRGVLAGTAWATGLGVLAAAVVALLAAGWAARAQRAAEAGLLLGAGLWAGRTAALVAVTGPWQWEAWLSACWAVASGGAWLLERAQPARRPGGR